MGQIARTAAASLSETEEGPAGGTRSDKSGSLRVRKHTVKGDIFACHRDAEMPAFVLIVPLRGQL